MFGAVIACKGGDKIGGLVRLFTKSSFQHVAIIVIGKIQNNKITYDGEDEYDAKNWIVVEYPGMAISDTVEAKTWSDWSKKKWDVVVIRRILPSLSKEQKTALVDFVNGVIAKPSF